MAPRPKTRSAQHCGRPTATWHQPPSNFSGRLPCGSISRLRVIACLKAVYPLRWAHGSSCSRLIDREGVVFDWWRVHAHGMCFLLTWGCQVGPFDPYMVGHFYLGPYLLVSCIFLSKITFAHFQTNICGIVNKSSYANIYSIWYSYFAWYLMVKMGQNRPSIRSPTLSPLLVLE